MSLSQPIIVCAACRNTDDKTIIVGPRHFDSTMRATIKAMYDETTRSNWEQGFIDQHGKFYDRKEAWEIAVKNNQIRREIPHAIGILYSENLY